MILIAGYRRHKSSLVAAAVYSHGGNGLAHLVWWSVMPCYVEGVIQFWSIIGSGLVAVRRGVLACGLGAFEIEVSIC